MWIQTHTIDSSGIAPRTSLGSNQPATSNQAAYEASVDSNRFWWGDHRRINDFAGYCCGVHQIMASFGVADSSGVLAHPDSKLAVYRAKSSTELASMKWSKFTVELLRNFKDVTLQQKHDIEAVAKSQVLNELYHRKQATTKKPGLTVDEGDLMESLFKARGKAAKARRRLDEHGIDVDKLLHSD